MSGPDEIAAVGEESVEIARAVLEAGAAAGHTKRHVGVEPRDAQFVEQPDQRGIAAVVVDLEAGVQGEAPVGGFEVVRVRVTAEARVTLEQQDVVAASQQPGGRQSGDAAADDRYPLNGRSSRAIPTQESACST